MRIEVPVNDQSIYELKTESGRTYLVRCPGTDLYDDKEDLFCFVVEGNTEELVAFLNPKRIVSFTKRADLPIPEKAIKPHRVLNLMNRRFGEGVYGFQQRVLE